MSIKDQITAAVAQASVVLRFLKNEHQDAWNITANVLEARDEDFSYRLTDTGPVWIVRYDRIEAVNP